MFSKFSSKEIAFALITFYPKWYPGKLKNISDTEKIRGDLSLEFIKKASGLGYRVVVVEGKSSENFRKQLDNFPEIKIIKRTGYKRSPARRQGFKSASKIPGVKVIIATEAEKVSLLDHIEAITRPILEGRTHFLEKPILTICMSQKLKGLSFTANNLSCITSFRKTVIILTFSSGQGYLQIHQRF